MDFTNATLEDLNTVESKKSEDEGDNLELKPTIKERRDVK